MRLQSVCAAILIPSTCWKAFFRFAPVLRKEQKDKRRIHFNQVKWSEKQWNMFGMTNQAFEVTLFFISCAKIRFLEYNSWIVILMIFHWYIKKNFSIKYIKNILKCYSNILFVPNFLCLFRETKCQRITKKRLVFFFRIMN